MTLDHSPLSDIQIRPDANGSDRYGGTRIVGRSPEGGVDPEADLVANQDHLAFVSCKLAEELLEAPRTDGQFGWCLRMPSR